MRQSHDRIPMYGSGTAQCSVWHGVWLPSTILNCSTHHDCCMVQQCDSLISYSIFMFTYLCLPLLTTHHVPL